MNNASIQLGSVELSSFEIPPFVTFGGGYQLSVHKLSSGQRVIEQLGPDDTDIRFAGAFSGPYAVLRARTIDNLRLTGQPIPLTWESFRYQVIIKSLLLRYKSKTWIDYKITCVVVDQPGVTYATGMLLQAQTSSDLAAVTATLSGYDGQLNSLRSALAPSDALTPGSGSSATAMVAVAGLQAALGESISANSTVLISSGTGPRGPARTRIVPDVVNAAGLLASAIIARGYVGRISRSIAYTGG